MNFTPEQLTKAKKAKSVEELIALAKESGMELTEAEAAKYFAELHKDGELSDEELGNVSGGGCDDDIYDWYISVDVSYDSATGRYLCPNCDDGSQTLSYFGYEYLDDGEIGKYQCDKCKKWYRHYTAGEKCGRWEKA